MAELSLNFIPPKGSDDSNNWINWYDQLERSFGKLDAKRRWTLWWNNTEAGKQRANSSDLRTQMKQRGVEVSPDGILGEISDKAKDFTGTIGNIFKIGATLSTAMTIIIVIVALAIVWRLAKPEAVGTVIKYAK
jgi:hypothetical protein